MSNTAEVVNFPSIGQGAATYESGEYVKADLEKGYDRLAQKLTDTLARPPVKLCAREYQIIFAVIGKTYRWHKKTDWISNSQLSDLTGIGVSNIGKLIKGLVAKKILVRVGKETGINPVVSDWTEPTISRKEPEASQKRLVENNDKTSQNRLEESSKTTKKLVKTDPHKRKETNTKDNNKKQSKKTLSDTLDFSCWPAMPNDQTLNDWLAMRKRLKANVTQTVVNRFAKQLHLAVQNGLTVDDCLGECVVRNWRGFEYAWVAKHSNIAPGYHNPQNTMQELQQLNEQLGDVPMLGDDQEV
tara:strand:- start:33910 stop:34809 length:900 start_codon:yes stop_codon:yes gene_type:complete